MSSAINSRQGSRECRRYRSVRSGWGRLSKFRPKVKDSLCSCQLTNWGHRWRGFPFSFFFLLFHSAPTFDAPCTSSSELAASYSWHKGNCIWSNVFSPTYFFEALRVFDFEIPRISTWTFRLLATMRDTEGTKFPKARSSKHRASWNPQPTSTFYQIQMYPSSAAFLGFWEKKLRSNGRVLEIYRRSCNNTKRFERQRMKNSYPDIQLLRCKE